MKRTPLVVLSCVVALVATSAAQADNLDKVTAALKSSPVYVEPGTPGTSSETQSELKGLLRDDDNIAVVLLPEGAISGNPQGFLKKLSAATGSEMIIGLAVGDQAYVYSPLLPPGVGAELMHSAANVSTNIVETLSTFIQNVHGWQAQNPAAKASKPKPKPDAHAKKSGGHGWLFVFVAITAGLITSALMFLRKPSDDNSVKLKAAPDPVKHRLERLRSFQSQVTDLKIRTLLVKICKDTDAYFARSKRSNRNTSADAEQMARDLDKLIEVVDDYVYVQNSDDDYVENKPKYVEDTQRALDAFSQHILNSIRRGSLEDLSDFRAFVQVLDAQRHT